jgi:hypothetical protein
MPSAAISNSEYVIWSINAVVYIQQEYPIFCTPAFNIIFIMLIASFMSVSLLPGWHVTHSWLTRHFFLADTSFLPILIGLLAYSFQLTADMHSYS